MNPNPLRRPSEQLLLLTCLAIASGCTGAGVLEFDQHESDGTPRGVKVYSDDGSFVLSTGHEAPDVLIRQSGPFLLEYVGAHRFVLPPLGETWPAESEGPAAPDEEFDPDPQGLDMSAGILIDPLGREWKVIDADESLMAESVEEYEAFHLPTAIPGDPTLTVYGDRDIASESDLYRATWTVWTCSQATKWEYNPGTSIDLDSLTSSNPSQRMPILEFNLIFSGTAVLIEPDLALTVGHAANGTAPGDELCARSGTSSSECVVVESVFVSGNGSGNDDWGLIRFTDSFSVGYEYVLSNASDGTINNFDPRLAGYPTLLRNQESTCTSSWFLEGERNTGTYHALTNTEARLNITAGGGASGAPYYYFNNGAYRIFGVHSYRGTNALGNKYCGGPKIPYWYDDIIAAANAL